MRCVGQIPTFPTRSVKDNVALCAPIEIIVHCDCKEDFRCRDVTDENIIVATRMDMPKTSS